jgi:hypothetical protein
MKTKLTVMLLTVTGLMILAGQVLGGSSAAPEDKYVNRDYQGGYAQFGPAQATRLNAMKGPLALLSPAPVTPVVPEPVEFPADMPATPYPDLKGCSNDQELYMKKAWRLAHYYTWRADRLIDYIFQQPEPERKALWNRDFIAGSYSPSPRRWFGPYDYERSIKVRDAMEKARLRFEMKGGVVDGVKVIRCGQPIAPAADRDLDVCPAGNPGSDSNGPPSAYHAPVGSVVTCPPFWNAAGNQFLDPTAKLAFSAKVMVHEIFHWLSVDRKYVTDHHGDGAGGEKDQKYYGVDKATYLAEEKQSWAVYNNDNYAWFIYSVGTCQPTYSAVWGPKDPGGVGAFYLDLTWEQLVEKWKTLSDNQYLSDVETYVKNGVRMYSAVWRIGEGSGALYDAEWDDFSKQFGELKKTQHLIDVEIYQSGSGWRFLGVYRNKIGRTTGNSGLLTGLSWEQLSSKWKEFNDVAGLCDVETYIDGDQRKYVAVWKPGKDNGALYQTNNWGDFERVQNDLHSTQELIDFEKFITLDGKWSYLGVWKKEKPSSSFMPLMTRSDLFTRFAEYKSNRTLLDVEEYTPLPLRIK